MRGVISGIRGINPRPRRPSSTGRQAEDWFSPHRVPTCSVALDFTKSGALTGPDGEVLFVSEFGQEGMLALSNLGPNVLQEPLLQGRYAAEFLSRNNQLCGFTAARAKILPTSDDWAVIAVVKPATATETGIIGQFTGSGTLHCSITMSKIGIKTFGNNYEVAAALNNGRYEIVTIVNSKDRGVYGRFARVNGASLGSEATYATPDASSPIWLFNCAYMEEFEGRAAGIAVVSPYNLAVVEQIEGYFAHYLGLTEQMNAAHPYKGTRPEN